MPKERVLLVRDDEGEFKITLPEGSRITFGPDIPFDKMKGSNNTYHLNNKSYALRVYSGKTNDTLIAVFAGVHNFRPLDMPHAKLVIRESGKSLWKSDETGFETQTSGKTERSFVDSAKLLSE